VIKLVTGMSGHSKWSTIKHQKAINDKRRGQLFTKLGKAVTLAAREGGGDLDSNFKLRLTVDKAKEANMPKTNIERAIKRGVGKGSELGLFEVVYEGFGPGQVAIIVEAVTDNKNRTTSEVKKTFEKLGGSLGQPGSVMFQFNKKGVILVKSQGGAEEQMLKLIDLGAEDVESVGEGLEVVVEADRLFNVQQQLKQAGFELIRAELAYLPKTVLKLDEAAKKKLVSLLETVDDLDDVQNVYCNLDI